MPIVFACAASHAPGITAWTERAPVEQADRLFAGFAELRDGLTAANPDVILLLTSEHWANFFLDHISAFCVGRADHFEGPIEPWLRVDKARIPGDPELAERILCHCYANGFEPGHAHEMKLDHGSMVPLKLLAPEMTRPVVPIMFNTLAPPRPSPARCIALGRLLGPLLNEAKERIAVIATGGLSHDPGERNHGVIDSAFDNQFLDQLVRSDFDGLTGYSEADLLAAGAGTLELLAWLCLAGIMEQRQARIVAYQAVKPWATGVGIVSYN